MTSAWDETRRPGLAAGCALFGLFGCFAVVGADAAGIALVPGHDPISDTISALAAGRHAWIQDLGLDLYALGLAALALGIQAWRDGGWRWRAGSALFWLLAIDIVVISEHDQYAGMENLRGTIHLRAVYALYLFFTLLTALLAFEFRGASARWYRSSLAACLLWLVAGPVYRHLTPESLTGAVERLIGLIMVAWVAAVSWALLRRSAARRLLVRS